MLSYLYIARTASLSVGVATIAITVAQAQDGEALVLDSIIVQAESNEILVQDGYVAKSDRIGTKVDSELVRIPQSISVVTQDQIEDQKPRTLLESLSYTAGANPNTFGYDSRYDAFYLRGFPTYYTGIFRDGLKQFNGPSAWFKTEPYGVEGVTVLKGPASSLYGVSGPGGIVNLVTKRPKEDTFREVELTVGEHNRVQIGADVSGPVTEDGSLLYRLTGVARKSETHLNGYDDNEGYIAPSFTWKPDEDTKLTVLGEYSRFDNGGTAAFFNSAYGEVSNIYGGDPNWNDFVTEQGRIGYEFEHRLNDVVTLRQNLRYDEVDVDLEYSGFYPTPPDRYWGHYREHVKNFTVDNIAQFEFATGEIDHTALLGFNYTWTDYSASQRPTVYAAFGQSLATLQASAFAPAGSQTMDQYGLYVHDQLEWKDLTVFASARYDWVKADAIDSGLTATEQEDQAFSGRIGLSYRTEPGLIPYASYSTSFSPNVGFVYDDPSVAVNRVADPTIGRQKEVGIKYEIPDSNAVISAAYFDIDQEDGVTFDTSSGVNRQVQRDMHSQGIEIEANASFDNGFSLIASYTYMKMEIESGAVGTIGNELSATPNHIASLWGHYLVQDGPLAGLGIGGGLRYVGESYGDDENTFKNSDRLLVDAALSYDFGYSNPELSGLSLQVNAKNVFDTRKSICSAGYCYWDEGRTIYGSLRYRF